MPMETILSPSDPFSWLLLNPNVGAHRVASQLMVIPQGDRQDFLR